MGKLLKPRGLKGELKAVIFNEYGLALKMGTEIWLKTKEENYFSRKIEFIKIAGTKSCVKLSACNSWEDADRIQGVVFYLSRDKFDPIGENEHYLVDMIGAYVIDETQNILGTVIDILSIPKQNIIVVETGENEVLVPYVDAYITLFDKQNNNLIVKGLAGLIN